jgi:hypothetical protein
MNAFRKSALSMLGVALLCFFSAAASAVTTAGTSSSIVLPVAAKTSSFETEVFVFNRNQYAISVDVLYYEANGLASPGQKTCNLLSLAANETKSFKLADQCPVLNDGASHFGLMVLRDHAAQKLGTFYGYSRVQHVTTLQGFSIEGFPEHVFSGSTAYSTGLKRNGPSPDPSFPYLYQSNCFVGSVGDPVGYRIRLFDGSGTKIGNDITGSLQPYQLIRYLDIFTVAGIPTGELTNVRVEFDETNTDSNNGGRSFIGFCTVQDNKSLGADFRVAKSLDSANASLRKLRCRGTGAVNDYGSIDGTCQPIANPATISIPNGATLHRWSMFVHHPDYIKCTILGANDNQLEMRLLDPAGAKVAGDTAVSSFYVETKARQEEIVDGVQAFWSLDVQARNAGQLTALGYGLECRSGSGISLSGQPTDGSRANFSLP